MAAAPHSGPEWIISPPHPQRETLAAEARIAPLLAQVLLNRGVSTAADAHAFLKPDFRLLLAPDVVPGVTEAAQLLHAAVRDRQRVVVYGDYDVDGITGTTILWRALKLAGGNVHFYIPSRLEEGYGLNGEAIDQLHAEGTRVLVTVDCGITSVHEVARAREHGLTVIVTDHHQPQDTLPDAHVICHPTACGPSPNPHLCGAAVALKLAWAFAREACGAERVNDEWREFLLDAMALAALGLVADVVPMVGENRIIATHGLKHLVKTENPGLKALIDVAGLAAKRSYDDYDVGFMLAPRLNAVGRLGHARLAVEMFTRAGPEQARQIATTLDGQNRQRQTVEREILKQAEALVVERGYDRDGCRAIVLASEQWHAGVIGIVAARLVDRFHRPTILIALEDGVGQGSGRSIRHFPLHEVLQSCGEHLLSHGGHAMAAGLRIAAEHVDAFCAAFQAQAAKRLTAKDLCARLQLDDEVSLRELETGVVEALLRLAPFGPGNARVRLATTDVELAGPPRAVGKQGAHLQFSVRQGQDVRKAIAFGRGKEAEALAECRRLRLAFEPQINTWNDQRRVELLVKDWRPASA